MSNANVEDAELIFAITAQLPEMDVSDRKHGQEGRPLLRASLRNLTKFKVDRNGNITDVIEGIRPNMEFPITFNILREWDALSKRRWKKEQDERLRLSETQLALARSERDALRAERDELSAKIRTFSRDENESRIAARIRQAVDAATESLQNELKARIAEVGRQQSEIAELREAKRKLKARAQGREASS